MTISAKVTGDRKVKRAIQKLKKKYPKAAGVAEYVEGQGVYRNMHPRTPFDTGELRDSEYVTEPQIDPKDGTQTVEIGAGADHAERVHEDTTANFTVGESEFMRKALAARQVGMAQRLADTIKREVEKPTVQLPSGVAPKSPQ